MRRLVFVLAARRSPRGPRGRESEQRASSDGRGNLNVTEKGGAEGNYKGVAPGAQALPPHPPKLPLKKGPQRMTWSGFQVKDGVPTVFLELTSAPEYHVEDAPGEVVVTLKNTVVPLRNNRRALDVARVRHGGQRSVDAAEGQRRARHDQDQGRRTAVASRARRGRGRRLSHARHRAARPSSRPRLRLARTAAARDERRARADAATLARAARRRSERDRRRRRRRRA